MNTQERLQKSRQELEEYKQINEEVIQRGAEDYAQRIEMMRQIQQRDPSFSNFDFADKMGMGGDPAMAVMLGQLNIEARIRALEAQAAQEAAVVQVPPQQIVAPPPAVQPPAQKQSLGRRLKNWFKRTFSRKAADAPAPVQAAPVQAQNAQAQGTGDCSPALPFIDQVQVASRVGEVRRFQKPSNPDPDAPDALVTREEMDGMRVFGARATPGNFLARRSAPVFGPSKAEVGDMFKSLRETPGFSFDTAVEGMKRYDNVGMGALEANEAVIAMAAKSLEMMQGYMQTAPMQEYIRLIYSSVEKVLLDNVKKARGPGALPNDADFDEHILQILPTRGLDCFNEHIMAPGISASEQRFALYCSKMVSKIAQVEKLCASANDPAVTAMFQPLLVQLQATKAVISQIGAQVRAQRLAEMTGGAAGGGNPPPPPAADPNPSIDNPPPA